MSKVLVTGSSDGLGLMAAKRLLAAGHEVILHARNQSRARDAKSEAPKAHGVVVGDLGSIAETRGLADQANRLGPFDAVIHNAGVGDPERRIETVDGLDHIFAINVLAPYLLTALIEQPKRLIYLSSGMHRGGNPDLTDLQWKRRRWSGWQAYSDSKLFDAVLALAMARRWPAVLSNAVDPGWVATKLGGRGAPNDLDRGSETQAWLATSQDPGAMVSGAYFYHKKRQDFHPAARDVTVQDGLLAACEELTGTPMPYIPAGACTRGPRVDSKAAGAGTGGIEQPKWPPSAGARCGDERGGVGEHRDRQRGAHDEAAGNQRATRECAAKMITPVRDGELGRPLQIVHDVDGHGQEPQVRREVMHGHPDEAEAISEQP
jgi:NAD(P)-dependent dehydrogenase (short-subunit alcohol dehydrogenase family)